MHAHDFQEPNEIQIGQNTNLNQESTHKCDKKENCPNYMKNPNQHMIEDTALKDAKRK